MADVEFNGETFPAHDAAEDVKATLRCVEELEKLQIIEIFPQTNTVDIRQRTHLKSIPKCASCIC